MWDLRERDRQPELMDAPHLDETLHRRALGALGRLNYFSRTARVLFCSLQKFVPTNGQTLRVLDLATGGGDVAVKIARLARMQGFPLQISGCDVSPTAINFAQTAARTAGLVDLDFFQLDALQDDLPTDFDVIICTLFLHHLTESDSIALVRRMSEAARLGLLIDDLRRTGLGYFLAWTVGRILSRSPIVHSDGPQSVRAAFTLDEVRSLVQRAGLREYQLLRHWPQRFLLSWSKPPCPQG